MAAQEPARKRQRAVHAIDSADEVENADNDMLSFLMSSPDTPMPVLEATAGRVANLFANDNSKNILFRDQQLLVEGVFACLKSSPIVQEQALKALGNFANHDQSQSWLVVEHNAINVIVDVLNQHPNLPDLQAQAYYALQKLATNHESNIRLIFKQHGHKLAVASMKAHANHVQLQIQAFALLHRLFWLDENRPFMQPECEDVVRVMQSFSSVAEIQEHGCMLMKFLASEDSEESWVFEEPYYAHEVVVSAMRNHPQVLAVQINGCEALRTLSLHEYDKHMLVGEPCRAHAAILSAMNTHSQSAVLQVKACSVLGSLAFDGNFRRILVREPYRTHEVILTVMRNHAQSTEVQERACELLGSLAFDEYIQEMLVQSDAHLQVITALRSHPKESNIQRMAVRALSNMSETFSNRQKLQDVGALEICEAAQTGFPDDDMLLEYFEILRNNLTAFH